MKQLHLVHFGDLDPDEVQSTADKFQNNKAEKGRSGGSCHKEAAESPLLDNPSPNHLELVGRLFKGISRREVPEEDDQSMLSVEELDNKDKVVSEFV